MAYGFYHSITVDHTKVPADQSNFPVVVTATSLSLRTFANGGKLNNTISQAGSAPINIPTDLVFSSDSLGATKYPWEFKSYNATTGVLVAWVLLPSVSASVDVQFYMVFGDAAVTTQQNTGSFAPSQIWTSYKSVWHFGDGASLWGTDSTGLSSANVNSTSPTSGKNDGCAIYSGGANNYAVLAASGSGKYNVQSFTVSNWVKSTTWTDAAGRIMFSYDFTSHVSPFYAIHFRFGQSSQPDGTPYLGWNTAGTGFQSLVAPAAAVSVNVWHYLVAVYTSGRQEIWVDGGLAASGTRTDTITFYTQPAWANRANFVNPGAAFQQEELRFAPTARSSDWIKTEYNSQNTPGNIGSPGFLTFSAETAASGSGIVIPALMNSYRQRSDS